MKAEASTEGAEGTPSGAVEANFTVGESKTDEAPVEESAHSVSSPPAPEAPPPAVEEDSPAADEDFETIPTSPLLLAPMDGQGPKAPFVDLRQVGSRSTLSCMTFFS